MSLWNNISANISAATGNRFNCKTKHSAAGGCINDSYVIEDGDQHFFVKLNRAQLSDMFSAEAEGLHEISASNSIACPTVICNGISGNQSYLVLQHLDLGSGNSQNHQQLGRDLADMHRHTANSFGWHRDNTIGATHQPNSQHHDWLEFWRKERLGFQLQLAAENGFGHELESPGQQLMEMFDQFFDNYQPQASLLHGDLWSGNYAITRDGVPVIFDPAVYYGDREADLAMTELFGGFPSGFYQAYNSEYPLDPGYKQRKTLYNLYHILNHLNLFGRDYLGQSKSMINQLLNELR